MTGRSIPEWIGSSPDAAIPPRVRLRVWQRAGGRCEAGCGRKLTPADGWQCDHVVALVNGGENREGNLRVACTWCHAAKTAADIAEKSKVAAVAKRHAGARAPTKRPIPGSKASGWRVRMNGRAERR